MKSLECKVKVLHYFRFVRRFKFIATEVGRFNSDILVSDETQIIEIEVKCSIADLKNEIKKRKHSIYSEPTSYYKKYIPNYFFFAVPESLIERIKLYLSDSPYGLISISEKEIKAKKDVYCKIMKKSKQIHKNFNLKLHDQIVLRMGSELIRGRLKELKGYK